MPTAGFTDCARRQASDETWPVSESAALDAMLVNLHVELLRFCYYTPDRSAARLVGGPSTLRARRIADRSG